MDRSVIADAQLDGLVAFHIGTEIDLVQSSAEFAHAAGRGIPFRQPHDIVDEPDECALHRVEGRDNLHDRAERQLTSEIFGRHQQQRHDGKQTTIGIQHHGNDALLANDVEPGSHDIGIGRTHGAEFILVATDERDAFSILAQPRHLGAKLRLRFILGRHPGNKRLADDISGGRGYCGIDHGSDRHIGGVEGIARQGHARGAGDFPKNGGECRGGDQSAEKAERQFDQRFDGEADIVGDTIFRRGLIGGDETQPIIALVGDPPAGDAIGQPFPPACLKQHARDDQC